MDKVIEFDGFTFTVLTSPSGHKRIYQDGKGYFGSKWLSVDELPPGKEELLKKINEVFGTKFVTENGIIREKN